jgi:acetamidase/formamidase
MERRTLHGHFSRDLEPILTIDPGDSIAFACPNAAWRLAADETFEPRDEELDAGHALVGPIGVRGAKAGRTLVVHIDDVRPGSFGETWAQGTRVVWTLEDGTAVDERGARVALAPFLGVIGMPPAATGIHSTGPPRRFGGNIDCKELVAGTTLYLPIIVERAQLTLDLSELELRTPIARTRDAWIAFGFDEDLDSAAEEAMATMLDLMERELRLERSYALALSSIVVDLRVTQIVNGVKGVHAVLRDDALRI